jgi:hypothetical protein
MIFGFNKSPTIQSLLGIKDEEFKKMSTEVAGVLFGLEYEKFTDQIAVLFPKADAQTRMKIILYAKYSHLKKLQMNALSIENMEG